METALLASIGVSVAAEDWMVSSNAMLSMWYAMGRANVLPDLLSTFLTKHAFVLIATKAAAQGATYLVRTMDTPLS